MDHNSKITAFIVEFSRNATVWDWSELAKWLNRFKLFLQHNPDHELTDDNLVNVSMTLYRCLNIAVPDGCRSTALEIYFYLLINIPDDKLYWPMIAICAAFQEFSTQTANQLQALASGQFFPRAKSTPQLFAALIAALLSYQHADQLRIIRPILDSMAAEQPVAFYQQAWRLVKISSLSREQALEHLTYVGNRDPNWTLDQDALAVCIETGSLKSQILALELLKNKLKVADVQAALLQACLSLLLKHMERLSRRVYAWLFKVDKPIKPNVLSALTELQVHSPADRAGIYIALLSESEVGSQLFPSISQDCLFSLSELDEEAGPLLDSFPTDLSMLFWDSLVGLLATGRETPKLVNLIQTARCRVECDCVSILLENLLVYYRTFPNTPGLLQLLLAISEEQAVVELRQPEVLADCLQVSPTVSMYLQVCALIQQLKIRGVDCSAVVTLVLGHELEPNEEVCWKTHAKLLLVPDSVSTEDFQRVLSQECTDASSFFNLAAELRPDLFLEAADNPPAGSKIFDQLDSLARVLPENQPGLGSQLLHRVLENSMGLEDIKLENRAQKWLFANHERLGSFLDGLLRSGLGTSDLTDTQFMQLLAELKHLAKLYSKPLDRLNLEGLSQTIQTDLHNKGFTTLRHLVLYYFSTPPRRTCLLKTYQDVQELLRYFDSKLILHTLESTRVYLYPTPVRSIAEQEAIANVIKLCFEQLKPTKIHEACALFVACPHGFDNSLVILLQMSHCWFTLVESLLPVFLRAFNTDAFKTCLQRLLVAFSRVVQQSHDFSQFKTLRGIVQILLVNEGCDNEKLIGLAQVARASEILTEAQIEGELQCLFHCAEQENFLDLLEFIIETGIIHWRETEGESKKFYLAALRVIQAPVIAIIQVAGRLLDGRGQNYPRASVFVSFLVFSGFSSARAQFLSLDWLSFTRCCAALQQSSVEEVPLYILSFFVECPDSQTDDTRSDLEQLFTNTFQQVLKLALGRDKPTRSGFHPFCQEETTTMNKFGLVVLTHTCEKALKRFSSSSTKHAASVLEQLLKKHEHGFDSLESKTLFASILYAFPEAGTHNIKPLCEIIGSQAFIDLLRECPQSYREWKKIIPMIPEESLLKEVRSTFNSVFASRNRRFKEKAAPVYAVILLSGANGMHDYLYSELEACLSVLFETNFELFLVLFQLSLIQLTEERRMCIWMIFRPQLNKLAKGLHSQSVNTAKSFFQLLKNLLRAEFSPVQENTHWLQVDRCFGSDCENEISLCAKEFQQWLLSPQWKVADKETLLKELEDEVLAKSGINY